MGKQVQQTHTRTVGAGAGGLGSRPLVRFYRSAVGKKYVMAVSGIVLMGYVLAHMLGNLKLYSGFGEFDGYATWLRTAGSPVLPRNGLLWAVRLVLVLALVLHVHAAFILTVANRRARPVGYRSRYDYAVAGFPARTMRWTGVIVGLFVVFHLLDLTWGYANPQFVHGSAYANVVASFRRWPVALVYVLANAALGVHLYHGAWSMFQSLGFRRPAGTDWRRVFAVAFAALVTLGNVTFPIAVMVRIVA